MEETEFEGQRVEEVEVEVVEMMEEEELEETGCQRGLRLREEWEEQKRCRGQWWCCCCCCYCCCCC